MKAFNQGAFLRVTADQWDVRRFADQWPCNGFGPWDRLSCTFDKRNGDLVDLQINGRYPPEESQIDNGAIIALVRDCQFYGHKRAGLPS